MTSAPSRPAPSNSQRAFRTFTRIPYCVRSATSDDCKAVLALQRDVMAEADEYFVRTVAELDAEGDAACSGLVSLLKTDNSCWIVAEMDGEIIGSLDFHGGRYSRIRHVGTFGMLVRRDYRNQGVGTALLETMLDWAHANPSIEKVTTTLFTTNARAMTLYSKHGFVGQGVRQREYQVSPGRYLDAVVMAKWVKPTSRRG
jgi:GNAT superfamily N-acetyltransferase